MTQIEIGRSDRCRRRSIAGLLLMCCSAPAFAGLPSENAATSAGSALVEAAASGHVAEAFMTAVALGRSNDPAFADRLRSREPAVDEQIGKLGATDGRVKVADAEPSIFSGCIRREYRVRYAGGEQRWLLKFRRMAGGWTLVDLEVVGPGFHGLPDPGA